MKIGTKSVLFGAHQFIMHPMFVALAWWKLYGFPWDPRLWIAFFVHDLGYIGKPNMDGEEGETHPELGARIMLVFGVKWWYLCLLHSRHYAKIVERPYSKLGVADKLATAITPAWIYVPLNLLTGEIHEYMARALLREHKSLNPEEAKNITTNNPWIWYRGVQSYLYRWAMEHRDLRPDVWTSARNH